MRNILIVQLILALTMVSCSQKEGLTKYQMLQDFDEMDQFLNDFAVHKDVNHLRLGIDYKSEFKNIRSKINKTTTICEFKEYLNQATNLVQDLHCSFPKFSYLEKYGKYQRKFNFKDDDTFVEVKTIEEKCPIESIHLEFPILYSQGKYWFYVDFKYQGNEIKKGAEILKYNGENISNFIKRNYDKVWPIRWDNNLKQPYQEDFYKHGKNEFKLTYGYKNERKTLKFNLKDSITYKTKPLRKIGYFSQSKEQVLYLDEQHTLYIGLPFMDVAQAESLVKKIDSISKTKNQFDKILLDVRGNPGGSDMAWRMVLSHLISNSIPYQRDHIFKFNKQVLDFYSNDSIAVKEKPILALNNLIYWSRDIDFTSLEPHENSLKHKGNIYVLQDKYIYSSTGNLSDFCLNDEKLISVGVSNDFIGGAQTDPLFKKLPNSGLVLRVEPMLDNTNVKHLSDLYHNNVEVYVPLSFEDYWSKVSYNGSIYSKDFLLNHDSLFKYVVIKNKS